MPRWLKGMVLPTFTLWFYAVAATFIDGVWDNEIPFGARFVGRFALALILAFWVMADAHKRGVQLCYDYDSLVFFFTPFVVPVYLFRTRGWKAFLTLLCFIGIWIVAVLIAMVAALMVPRLEQGP